MRGGNMLSIGLILLIPGSFMGFVIGSMTFLLLSVGAILSGLGLRQLLAGDGGRPPAGKRNVFIKCPYCRAMIPMNSDRCSMCGADSKK